MAQAEEVPERYKVGDRITNCFEVYRVLTGRSGAVYVCYDHRAHIPLAIERFAEEYALSDKDVRNFEWEAYECTKLESHENIVRAYLVEVIGERPYILTEFIARSKDIDSSLTGWLYSALVPEHGEDA